MPNVVSCIETYGNRSASLSVSGPQVTIEYVRHFKIQLDSGGPGAEVAASSASALPAARDSHPFFFPARVRQININPDSQDDKVWLATVTYATDTQDESQQPENPLDEPPQVEWGFQQFQRVADRDINKKPIINSAKEQFDPLPEVDDSRLVLRYSRNEPSFPVGLARLYQDAVNSDDFLGSPKGTVKCQNISASRQFRNDVYYWAVSYEFHFRNPDDDWELHLLDAGYRELIGGIYFTIHDGEGLPINQPALLDGSGGKLEPTDDPKFLDFKVFRELPFTSAFNINI